MTTVSESTYPLQWPLDRPRTPHPSRSKFKSAQKASIAAVRDELFAELRRYGASNTVLSTNLKLRLDGLPLSGQPQPRDKGVAVYFTDRKKRRLCFACDRWDSIEENIYSITKTIDALRGVGRWGMQEAVDAAFTGFQALPPPSDWMTFEQAVLFLAMWGSVPKDYICDSRQALEKAVRAAQVALHPDKGGSEEDFKKIAVAEEAVRRQTGWQ